MNPVKSIRENMRKEFYGTLLGVAGLVGLSGCGGDEPEPVKPVEEPKITNLSGKTTTRTGFGIGLSPLVADVRIMDEKTGDIYDVTIRGADAGYGDNATMTLSDVDVLNTNSQLELIRDSRGSSAAVFAQPTKEFKGTITFYDKWADDVPTKFSGRLYDLKKIDFTSNATGLGDSWNPSLMDELYADPAKFRKTSVEMFTRFNDANQAVAGNQPQPVSVVVTKYVGN